MLDALRPVLSLTIVIPALFLAYVPVQSYLRQPVARLLRWLLPLMLALTIGGGLLCYRLRLPTAPALALITLIASAIYIRTLHISLWKSGTIVLSVCAVFACLGSLARAFDAAVALHKAPADEVWFCLKTGICYNAVCWLALAIACYPARHVARKMIEDENFAQTWYVFWILPIVFIGLNLFMIPNNRQTLYTGRILQGYIIISLALLLLLAWFIAIFLVMANSLNRNARLQQENHFLSMQRERYENLKTAIEDARQARHDMRHYFNQISALAESGQWDQIKEYISGAVERIPNLDVHFCENRAADSVIGYYCALARREGVPFQAQADLPVQIPVNEIDMSVALANLLENALEASLRTAPARRQIRAQVYLHSNRLLLIQVENAYDGSIQEKNGVFQSTKHKGNGIGVQSVRRIAEKTNGACTFSYQNGVFSAKVMMHGNK